jgi:hypothetical protein
MTFCSEGGIPGPNAGKSVTGSKNLVPDIVDLYAVGSGLLISLRGGREWGNGVTRNWTLFDRGGNNRAQCWSSMSESKFP